MKKSLTVKVLEILGEGLMTATDVVTAILESGYGASYAKIDRNYRRIESVRIDRINAAKERQRFYNLISKLKREGLITGKEKLRLTLLGKDKILKSKINGLGRNNYKKEKDSTTKIITFDIPEKDRSKRDWFRAILVELGFTMLQKSVWVGKVKIPEDFLEDLRLLKISQCVHIFTAEKLGTIDFGDD